eukprot:3786049-Alexandrium_andersonii.AAC.1
MWSMGTPPCRPTAVVSQEARLRARTASMCLRVAIVAALLCRKGHVAYRQAVCARTDSFGALLA